MDVESSRRPQTALTAAVEEVKGIESLRGVHAGQDIYVLASGKSLDHVPKSFFDGKVTVGVNQVYKWLTPTYLVRKETEMLKEALVGTPKTTTHVVSRGNAGDANTANADFVATWLKSGTVDASNVVVFDHDPNAWMLRKPLTLPDADSKLVVSFSTITTAIHLAAVLGAANIVLVGHDCGTLDGHTNIAGYHTPTSLALAWGPHPDTAKTSYTNWLGVIERDTVRLRGLLKDVYGCNVVSLNPFVNFRLEGHAYVPSSSLSLLGRYGSTTSNISWSVTRPNAPLVIPSNGSSPSSPSPM